MLRLKIEVNDGVLDLSSDADELFYITKQLNDLHNLQNRQADFTRTLEVPRTKNNDTLLGLLTNERLGNEGYTCNVLIDDILLLPYAKLFVTDISGTNLTIAILSGNFELFDAIPNESIKELDFSSYNFAYNQVNLATLNTTTEGVLLSAIQWYNYKSMNDGVGVPSTVEAYDEINNYGFSMHIRTIVKAIIENAGYIYDDSLINTDTIYKDIVLACPVNVPALAIPAKYANWDFVADFNYDDTDLGAEVVIPFDNQVSDIDSIYDNTNFWYKIQIAANYKITFDFDIDYVRGAGTTPCILRIEKNGNLLTQTQLPNTGNYVGNINATDDFLVNDEIQATIQCGYKTPSQFDTATINKISFFELRENVDDPTGNLVVSDWLPEINQRDLLLDFLKIFNAFIDSNPFAKTTSILKWNDYIDETPQDLTLNVDASQEIINNISMDGYYKESKMSYSNDSDVTRTDSEIIANFSLDESLPLFGNILKLLFSGSEQGDQFTGPLTSIAAPYNEGNYRNAKTFSITSGTNNWTFTEDVTIYPGEYIKYGTRMDRVKTVNTARAGLLFNNYHVTLASVEIQILNFTKVELTPRIGIVDRAGLANNRSLTTNTYGTNAPVITVVNVYNTEFLTFETIKSTYYQSLFDALQTPKIIKVWMNFSTLQFSQIDMLKPVYIEGFNGSFYINKIEQFKINSPCRVELIRINSLI